MKKTKVHVISHSHWDREWYFTSSRSTMYLVNHVKEVIELLENNPNFPVYLMDAQSSLVEDYLKYCPEDEERLKKLIKERRFLIGPWYTQTDQLVISQESIVRNMYYGKKYAEEMGHSFNVAYAPDIFGQGGNVPQIYNNFGIDRFLFWRGVADNRLKQTEFIWEGDNGSKLLALQMPFGYYYGGNIPEKDDEILPYLDEKISKLEEKASTSNVYFPNGFDQAPIRKNLPEIIEKFNKIDEKREYIFSSPEKIFDYLEKEVNNLPIIKGELTEGKHSRLHKSIFSTRADLKILNNKIENFIVNTLEPILSISHSLGNRYPHKEVYEIWKLMFENSAHDSIGGCNSDKTNKDVYFRYIKAKDMAENLLDLNMRLISKKTPFDHDYSFTIFNTLPYHRKGVIEAFAYLPEEKFEMYDLNGNKLNYTIVEKIEQTEYVLNQHIYLNPSKKVYIPKKVFYSKILIELKNVPSLGFTQIFLNLNEKKEILINKESKERIIENTFYKIEVLSNNTLNILDKKNNKLYKNQMIFEENGDDGDSYNYSPPVNDLIVNSLSSKELEISKKVTEVYEGLELKYSLKVPNNLEDRAKKIINSEMKYNVKIELRNNEEIIRFKVNVENNAYSHRFCVVFDSEIASKVSTADQVFGAIERPVRLKEMDVWEEEKWQEAPISIEPFQSYVSLNNENGGIALITDGVREYEIIGEDFSKIRLTLFRTFGFMGKENLLYRPGRASGESIVETPDAQLIGNIELEFSFYAFENEFEKENIAKISKEYLSPFTLYQFSEFLNGRLIFSHRDEEKTLPKEYSLFEINNENLIMSAFKKAENTNEYIVRVFNPYLKNELKLLNLETFKSVKLDETTVDEKVTVLKPYEFKTFLIKKGCE